MDRTSKTIAVTLLTLALGSALMLGCSAPGAAAADSADATALAPSRAVAAHAARWLTSFQGFEGAKISAWHPLYDPDGHVDYWEAELAPQGYLILGATRRNFPMVEFSAGSPSHFAQLSQGAREPFRMMRFGPGYLAAVSPSGDLLAEVGERPRLLPPECQVAGLAEEKLLEDQAPVRSVPSHAAVPAHCAQVRKSSLAELRAQYRRFLPDPGNAEVQQRLGRRWDEVEARAAEASSGRSGALSSWTSGGWNYFFARDYDYGRAGSACSQRQDITYFTQIPNGTFPNLNDEYSGCGPTAWANYLGWWDLHGRPGTLAGAHQVNDSYIGGVTMALNDLLNVHGAPGDDAGHTFTWDIANGYQFVTQPLQAGAYTIWNDIGYWYKWQDIWPIPHDSIYEVARDAIGQRKIPLITYYGSDSHITMAYGLAESVTGWQDDSWVWINPAWSTDECRSKWISKDDVHGFWSLTWLRLVRDFDFESSADTDAAPGFPSDPNGWYAQGSGASFGIEHALGTAASGANNAFIVLDKAGHSGLQKIAQAVTVEPYRHYRLTASVRTGALRDQYTGYVSVRGANTIQYGQAFGALPSYTTISVDFTVGNDTSVEVSAALWSDGTADPTQWLRLDTVNVWLMDSLEDGEFEMQTPGTRTLRYPWAFDSRSEAATNWGISNTAAYARSGNFAWVSNQACATCTGVNSAGPGQKEWVELTQTISVALNTTYRVSAWVNVTNAWLGIGAYDAAGSVIGSPQYFPGVTNQGWKQVSTTFSSGNRDSVQLFFGYPSPSQAAGFWLDGVSVQAQ
jgi:hypothetical protein